MDRARSHLLATLRWLDGWMERLLVFLYSSPNHYGAYCPCHCVKPSGRHPIQWLRLVGLRLARLLHQLTFEPVAATAVALVATDPAGSRWCSSMLQAEQAALTSGGMDKQN